MRDQHQQWPCDTAWVGIKAVMLDKHGPNIVFNKDVDPQDVIDFIEENFDLEGRTDGVPFTTD